MRSDQESRKRGNKGYIAFRRHSETHPHHVLFSNIGLERPFGKGLEKVFRICGIFHITVERHNRLINFAQIHKGISVCSPRRHFVFIGSLCEIISFLELRDFCLSRLCHEFLRVYRRHGAQFLQRPFHIIHF